MKRPLFFYIPLAILIALLGYAVCKWEDKVSFSNVTYPFLEPRTGIFDDVELASEEVLDKLKRGDPLSESDWEELNSQQIRLMEKIDEKAARLMEKRHETGHLAPEDQAYLSEKIKELNRVVLRESPGRPKRK